MVTKTLDNVMYNVDKTTSPPSAIVIGYLGTGISQGSSVIIPNSVQGDDDNKDDITIYTVVSVGPKAFEDINIPVIYLPQPTGISNIPFFSFDSFDPSSQVIVEAVTNTPFILPINGKGLITMSGNGKSIYKNGLQSTYLPVGQNQVLAGQITSPGTYNIIFTDTGAGTNDPKQLKFQIVAIDTPTPPPTPKPIPFTPILPFTKFSSTSDNSYLIYVVAAVITLLILAVVLYNYRQKLFS